MRPGSFATAISYMWLATCRIAATSAGKLDNLHKLTCLCEIFLWPRGTSNRISTTFGRHTRSLIPGSAMAGSDGWSQTRSFQALGWNWSIGVGGCRT